MTIEKTVNGKQAEMSLKGWLDTQNAEALAAAVDELAPDTESLTLDMSGLEYISSAGIRQLVATHMRMKGALTMKHVSAEILDVLHMSGLDIFLALLLSGKAAVWYDQKAWTRTVINPPDDYFCRRGST